MTENEDRTPWTVDGAGNVVDVNNNTVAIVTFGDSYEACEPYSRMISAAPDLIDASTPFMVYFIERFLGDRDLPDDFVVVAYAPDFRGKVTKITLGDFKKLALAIAKAGERK